MGSPRILETVCGSIKFVIVCKLGLDLVAFLMTGENNIRYFRRRMYAVVPAAWHTKNTFPLPQPSVPVKSRLGAFSGILPEGDSITEGFYINSIALPMKSE